MTSNRLILSTLVFGIVLIGLLVISQEPQNKKISSDLSNFTEERSSFIEGKTTNTRIRKSGNITLDDHVKFKDNYTWTKTSESDFKWDITVKGSASYTKKPDKGRIYINLTSNSSDKVRFDMDNGFKINVSEHPSWRINARFNSSAKTNGNVFEWTLIDGPETYNDGSWLLYDAGGGDQSDSYDKPQEGCSEFDNHGKRRDQLLTYDGDKRECWSQFKDAPINWEKIHSIESEYLGKKGEFNAYLDGKLQADLERDEGQIVPTKKKATVMQYLRSNGFDEDITLRYISLQKVGVYQRSGHFSKIIDAGKVVEWEEAIVEKNVPKDTSLDIKWSENSSGAFNASYENIEKMPDSRYLRYNISMSTNDNSSTPEVSSIEIKSK